MRTISLVIPVAPGIGIDALDSAGSQEPPVAVLVEEGGNPSANRNRGIDRADSPLIGFTNAHTLLREDWSRSVEAFFNAHPEIDIVGGPQLNHEGDPYFARLSGDALASPFCTMEMSRRYQPAALKLDAGEEDLTSANLICRRHVFDRVRFDESIYPGEDPKFVADACRAGFKVAYTPEIVVFNRRRTSVSALWRQVFRYGAARVQKETFSELLQHPKFFIPALFACYMVVLPGLLIWVGSPALLPLAAYGLLAFCSAILQAVTCRRAEYALLLPFVFLWIHIAYGIGFLSRWLKGGWKCPSTR